MAYLSCLVTCGFCLGILMSVFVCMIFLFEIFVFKLKTKEKSIGIEVVFSRIKWLDQM